MLETLIDTEIRARDGSRVALRREAAGDVLETRDRAGRLVFEFHPATGRAVVHVPGALEVRAGDSIRFHGASIDIEADAELRLRSGTSAVTLAPGSAALQAERLGLEAEAVRLTAARVSATVGEARVRADLLDHAVGRALLWAREVVQRVDGLLSLHAGRVRARADGDYTVQARAANLTAREDFRVQGETIHLG